LNLQLVITIRFVLALQITTGAYGKAGNGNETETGNRNGTKKNAPITGVMFSHVLCHFSGILPSNGHITSFMSHALPLLL